MSLSEQNRSLLQLLIAGLCIGALVLAVVVLSGDSTDDTAYKVLATAIAVALLSLPGAAGVDLARRRPSLALLGYMSAIVALAALAALLDAIWSADLLYGGNRHQLGYTLVLALAGAESSLLLRYARPEDSDTVRLVRGATVISVGALAVMGVAEIASPGPDIDIRLMAFAAVVFLWGALLIPLLRLGAAPELEALSPLAPMVETGLPPAPPGGRPIQRLDHVVIGVSDWARSNAFYGGVLGAEVLEMPQQRVAYRIGEQQLNVHGLGTAAEPLAALPVQPGNSDLCFIWNGPIHTALEHLSRHGVEMVEGPVARIGARGPGQSVYCRDPDGSLIELISYES